MNKSLKKCCICNNDKIGEFIVGISGKKYHLCCIENLQSQLEQKEKQLNEIKEYAVNKVNKSFLVDMGLSENRSYRLFTETVIELQKIIDIIERNNSNE